MSPEVVEFFRYAYALLAVVCATGFIATLIVRWEVLKRGEKILRFGLIVEHLIITYGSYVALKNDYPSSIVGLLLTASMVVIALGFVVWIADDILPGRIDMTRLTD